MKNNISTNKTGQFSQVLTQIQTAKRQAYSQINSNLVALYWKIGNQVKSNQWGKGVVEELAVFIKNSEPNLKGFTARNMWLMKQFYELYQHDIKLHSLSAVLSWTQNRRIMSLKNDEEAKYTLNRSLSPTMVADYQTQLIPKELLRTKLNEFYELLDNKDKK